MDDKKTRTINKTIDIKVDSDKEFFLIHGYTGSTTDFNKLPEYLSKKFNANVKVLMLKGHGTKIEDLDNVTYKDFKNQLYEELGKDIQKGRKIILGGVSMGALFALLLASEYRVKAVFNVCPPYILKFPFNIKSISYLGKHKKYWKKMRNKDERLKRIGSFSYDYMHANGLKILYDINIELKKRLKKIKCPVLTIHSITDPIGHHKSVKEIHSNIKSFIKKKRIFRTNIQHNVFYSMNNDTSYKEIIDFIEGNNLFGEQKKEKVTAIIPAFNEAKRIGAVLNVVSNSEIIDEIIVIDDGSTDDTEKIVREFKNVRYLKNKKNLGKASSMDLGVASTDADIIFFCDADLVGLNQNIINEIIEPVKAGDFNMFIGLRENFMQKSINLFAINSGERAIRRVVWEELPKYFKYKYRVEAGLNYYVKKYFGGFGCKRFNYSQPTKEKKYGFVKGTVLRWSMNIDVLSAYIREMLPFHFRR